MFCPKPSSTIRAGFAVLSTIVLSSATAMAMEASPLAARHYPVSSAFEPVPLLIAERHKPDVKVPKWDKKAKVWRIGNLRPTFHTRNVAVEYAKIAARLSRYVRECELSRYKGYLRDLRAIYKKKHAANQLRSGYADRLRYRLGTRPDKNAQRIQRLTEEIKGLQTELRDLARVGSVLDGAAWSARNGFKKGSPFEGCTKQGHRKSPPTHSVNLSRISPPKASEAGPMKPARHTSGRSWRPPADSKAEAAKIKELRRSCKLHKEERDKLRKEINEEVGLTPKGKLQTLDQAIGEAQYKIIQIRAIQEGLDAALKKHKSYLNWTARKIEKDEMWDPDKDKKGAKIAIGKIIRKVLSIHPAGKVVDKIFAGAEKLNSEYLKLRIRAQYEKMLAEGRASVRELQDLHRSFSAEMGLQIARKKKLRDLKRRNEEVWNQWATEELRLRKLASNSAKLKRTMDDNGDCREVQWYKRERARYREKPKPKPDRKRCDHRSIISKINCVTENMGK
jgi:hypothetical protein